nr:hypothetical protein [Lachnospiraceae bacterium]
METKSKKDVIADNMCSFLLVFFLLCMVFSWVIAYYPHYEKYWYEKTEPVTWEKYEKEKSSAAESGDTFLPIEFSGYPTAGMKTELKSYEDFLEKRDEVICLEVDASELKPTGVYEKVFDFSRSASGSSYSKYNMGRSGTVVTPSSSAPQRTGDFGAFFYRYKAIYAQYYVLSLEERDRILILINDSAVDIPKKGIVRLPCAARTWTSVDMEDVEMWELILANNLQYDSYYEEMYTLDASTWWFEFGLDKDEFQEFRAAVAVILLVGGAIGIFLTLLTAVLRAKYSR